MPREDCPWIELACFSSGLTSQSAWSAVMLGFALPITAITPLVLVLVLVLGTRALRGRR